MKRDRDEEREGGGGGGGGGGEKMFRMEGGRGRGRSNRGRANARRPPTRGLDYAGYDYSQGYEVPIVDPDEVELKADLEVRREMVGPVIGRQGQTVTQIRKDTGAQIHIRDSVPGETDQIIEVKGTRSQVEDAYQQIRQVLSAEDEDYAFHHPGIKSALILVHIAPEMVGCLIGKAGKNVKLIKEDTGANIRVDAQVDNQPFQTVNVTGPIQSVIEAYVRVSDCLRSFDPKKSKMLRGIDDPNPIANVPIPQNQVYNSSANFGAGSVMATDQSQYITAGQQHQTFIIQAPIQSTPGGPPAVLVLQPDGTYQPAPVIFQSMQQNQTASPGVQYATCVSVAQDPNGGTANLTGVTVPQYQYTTAAGAASQTGQSQIVLPSGGTMLHSSATGIVGNPPQSIVGTQPQSIVGIQPTRLSVSGGMTLTPGVIGQQQ